MSRFRGPQTVSRIVTRFPETEGVLEWYDLSPEDVWDSTLKEVAVELDVALPTLLDDLEDAVPVEADAEDVDEDLGPLDDDEPDPYDDEESLAAAEEDLELDDAAGYYEDDASGEFAAQGAL